MLLQPLAADEFQSREFCERWRVAKLELFGSTLTETHPLESDVDLLVTFAADADWGLFDHSRMERELSELLGRPTDLISRRAVEASQNVIRRNAILGSAVPVYVAQ